MYGPILFRMGLSNIIPKGTLPMVPFFNKLLLFLDRLLFNASILPCSNSLKLFSIL